MEEKVLMEGLCNRIKSKIFVENGHGMLTNQRFIYSKHSFAKLAVMGVLANLTKGNYEFDIPISEINSVTRGKHGLSNSIIVIITKNKEEYKFAVTKYIDWEIAFKNALNGYAESQEKKESEPIAQGEKKFCTNCGGILTGNEKFCGSCGTKVE